MSGWEGRLATLLRSGLIAALAVATIGCGESGGNPKRSVTIKLREPRPYRPEPGFSLATAVPHDDPATPKASSDVQN